VLVMEDDLSSPILEWMARAPAQGFTVGGRVRGRATTIGQRLRGGARRPGAPVALVSVSNVHGRTGRMLDLLRIAAAARRRARRCWWMRRIGAGVTAIERRDARPDFLIFPNYKWVLGPYGARLSPTSRSGTRRASRSSRPASGARRC